MDSPKDAIACLVDLPSPDHRDFTLNRMLKVKGLALEVASLTLVAILQDLWLFGTRVWLAILDGYLASLHESVYQGRKRRRIDGRQRRYSLTPVGV